MAWSNRSKGKVSNKKSWMRFYIGAMMRYNQQENALPPPMTPLEIQYQFQSWVDQQTALRLQLQNQGQEPKEEEDFYT